MKKRKFQMVLPLFMVCIIGSGCTSKQADNNLIDMTESTQQTDISIENSSNLQESNDTASTEETKAETTASTTSSETSTADVTEGQSTNSSEDVTETTMETNEMTENTSNSSEIKSISGYQMVDGMNVPVEVTFELADIKRGEEAYNTLLQGKADLELAEDGMEYILITLNVSYVSGDADTVYIMENVASLEDAKMYFALSDGESNAVQLTDYLSDSIYNLAINKGESAKGTVAFLHRVDNQEPLQFVGFGKSIQFNLE